MLSTIARDFPLPSLNNADFLKELAAYLKAGEGSSSINVTHKRLLQKSNTTPDELSSNVVDHPSQFETNTTTYHVLIRAKYDGDKSLTTAVAPEDLSEFWTQYSQVLKSGFKLKIKAAKK